MYVREFTFYYIHTYTHAYHIHKYMRTDNALTIYY